MFIMIPIKIECSWGSIPPTIFAREVVFHLPYRLSFNKDRDCKLVETRGMTIYSHRTIDGKEGNIVSSDDSQLPASDIHDMVKRMFPFSDLRMIRLRGECLTDDGFKFISDLGEYIYDEEDDFRIIIETTLRVDGAWNRLDHLMKESLIDHACLYMIVPGNDVDSGTFARDIDVMVNGLTGCIMAIRKDNLRSVDLCLVITETSSIEKTEEILSKIKTECMGDDYYLGMKGIAMVSFGVTLLPVNDSVEANELASNAFSQMSINYFDENKITVVPPGVSRAGEWIDF